MTPTNSAGGVVNIISGASPVNGAGMRSSISRFSVKSGGAFGTVHTTSIMVGGGTMLTAGAAPPLGNTGEMTGGASPAAASPSRSRNVLAASVCTSA